MDPMRFKSLGPSKDMSFLCTHVFRWPQKPHVFWWTQKIIKGPLKDMRFGSIKRHEVWVEKWVHQKTWGFRGENFENICTNWVHQKTWDFERGKSWFGSIKRHEVFGSIKRHEISLRETQKLVHQSTWALKFCYWCTSGFIDCDNCSKSGHWGCGGKAPFRFSEHCSVLGFG